MPWEFLITYTAKKVLDAAAKKAPLVYVEHIDDSSRYEFQSRVKKILGAQGQNANLTFIVGTTLTGKYILANHF